MTLLFDIGKVLLDFDFESSLRKLIPDDEPQPDERLRKILGDKDAFERGDIPLDDYLAQAERELGPAADRETFIAAWRNIFTPNVPMWQVVEDLKAQGHRLLYFSNINPIHAPWIFENYDVFRHFEGGTCSYLAKLIKPEPAIYRHVIETYGLTPAETLYIDDLPANIESGIAAGFQSHLYDLHRHDAFETWLSSHLQVPPQKNRAR
ncbi:putative hydrolase of the HAD superfamily [Haloferula luteola]|uniref:Putative hydrolase of the HAD superfamily n=1 Tax=Haloferula luteola TaxID=595692 RepID=A0A840VFE7_9BACT|nr:HAD family phosphatase [Haloferula luteola]MBB5353348.1 putative hydrolase of the HAD superfamily [Haloferula luteola]